MTDYWAGRVVFPPPEDAARYREAGYWAPRTIPQELQRVASASPGAPALFDGRGSMTFAELDEASDRVACGLTDLGLEIRDRVLLQLGNCRESVVAWYGLLKAGLIPVCTIPHHRGHEIGQIAASATPRGYFVEANLGNVDLVDLAKQIAAEQPSLQHLLTTRDAPDGGTVRLEDLGQDLSAGEARQRVDAIQAEIDPDDVAVFQLSGGTTGTPKLIPRLHAEYWYNSRAYAERMTWGASTRASHPGPVTHNGPIVCGLHATHSVGAAFVMGVLDPETYLAVLEAASATDVILMPGWVPELRRHPKFDAAFAHVRRVQLAGTKVPRDIFDFFEGRGNEVVQVFGTGEGLVMATPPGAPAEIRATTVGWPVSPMDEVRLLEAWTEEPAADNEGELCARGPYTIRGYFDAPERNAVAFTSHGFYRTGDVARVVEIEGQQCFTIEGRIKDVVNRGGEKINCEEIEVLLADHPSIQEAALVGMPDERLGERACAYIVLAPGAEPVGLEDIRQYMEARQVARFKWPERIEILDAMPRTGVDKVNKRALREDVAAKLAGTRARAQV